MQHTDRLADGQVLYLSTLAFPEQWLENLREVSDRLVVVQRTCDRAEDVPDDLWQEVQILHTSTVFPHPCRSPKLAWVQLDTAGVDHVVNEPIWRDVTVPITTLAGVSARMMAEYVVLMLLAFSHRLPRMLELQRQHSWPSAEDRWREFRPSPLAGTRVAVIGFGRIGRAVGRLCAALGMDVTGVRRGAAGRTVADEAGLEPAVPEFPAGSVTEVGPESLREILRASDAVVVAVPLTPQTAGLLDREMLLSVKPGAVLVNVSRGGVVDEATVAELLAEGRLAAAAFDVFEHEPLPAADPLWEARNMLLSPHVAGFAAHYPDQVKALMTENLRRFLDGRPLLNQANRSVGY